MLIAIIKDVTKIKPKSSRLSEYEPILIEEFKGALIAKKKNDLKNCAKYPNTQKF